MKEHKRILVIEDDNDTRELLQELLEVEGYDVDTAANGKDGLAKLRTSATPSMILLDLAMPVMDGCAFRQYQQNDPKYSKIPVVILSADDHLDTKQMFLGAVGLLKKPIDLTQILRAVHKYAS